MKIRNKLIIGSAVGVGIIVAGMSVLRAIFPPCDMGTSTEIFLEVSHSAFVRFRIDTGRFPATSEGLDALVRAPLELKSVWRGPYIDTFSGDFPKDLWGNDYRYRYPSVRGGDSYDLWSTGEDGKISDDDIWNNIEKNGKGA